MSQNDGSIRSRGCVLRSGPTWQHHITHGKTVTNFQTYRPTPSPTGKGLVPRSEPSAPAAQTVSAPAGTSAVPDEVLIRQARLGEKDAFAQLSRRHGPALYRFVLRLLGEPADAQDCAQEALFAAWKNLPSFRRESTFRTWLLVLGRNEAQKIIRRNRPPFPQSGSRAPLDFDQVTAQLRDLHVGPEGDTVENQLLVALDAALLQLPERQRTVWILREIEDLSHAEIAAVAAITPASVRGLLQRARAAVAISLEEWR